MPKSNGGRPPSKQRSSSGPGRPRSPAGPAQTAKPPRRREIMASICFILAVFSFIGYWNTDGAFIKLFIDLVKGLVGHGFFALPPVLLLCSVILSFHKGRPVQFRVICSLLLAVLTGALAHRFACEPIGDISFGMFSGLWEKGLALESGGAVGGSITEVFTWMFGSIGAAVILICASLFLLLAAFNRTIAGVVDAIRNRERRRYIPEPEPEPVPPHPYPAPAPWRRDPSRPKSKKVIDIPIDDAGDPAEREHRPESPREKLLKGGSRVKTPDQLIAEYSPDEAETGRGGGQKAGENAGGHDSGQIAGGQKAGEDAGIHDSGQNADEDAGGNEAGQGIIDLPLDIPFMENRRGGGVSAPPVVKKPPPAAVVPEVDPFTKHKKPKTESHAPADGAGGASDGHTGEPGSGEPPAGTPAPGATAGPTYVFPPLELLSLGDPKSQAGAEDARAISEMLEAAFRSFGVNVKISNSTRGPSVTRYEAELEAGVKLSKLTSLADDIALSLGTSGVRIAAMPNKISTVGIEVPNKSISTVCLRDIIESHEFSRAKSKLTFAIGMDISGEAIVGNISKLPHMLVAGTTGSGKSVCLNSLILSILYKATPEDVRFIMIDPKMVEFKVYNAVPHLLVPVVTDVKKAAGALQWAVFEMMKRYALFADTNARDIDGYNQIASKSDERETLPHVIVVIDELADLMMMAAKEVEESVCRVAQMGRAAGMHLVISTQSPRADVITGLMKANIPTRIALKVSSALESRIILDAGGNADKLVGNGDMLYAPIGTTKPMRLQGTWVSDEERESVVDYIKKSGESQYSEEVIHEIEKAAMEKPSGDKSKDEPEGGDFDELLPQAVEVIFESGQASVSMLQRRLKLGYSRAARIVDQMEQMGIVGPFEGSKPRAMLVTREQWRQMQYVSGIAPVDKAPPDYVVPVSDFDSEQDPGDFGEENEDYAENDEDAYE